MRPERGFTLLETILALAVGGLVLGAAYTAVVRAAAARDQAVARGHEVNAGRQALLEVAHALEAASPRRLSADAHALHFEQAEPEPVAITYEMDGTRLVERRVSPFAATRDDAGTTRALLDGARAFGVRCFDKGDWVAGWSHDAAPRALELALALADGEEFHTRVVLPLGTGE
jgi:prepilin-type N-terminal cleavage/methylation domain-containing protein